MKQRLRCGALALGVAGALFSAPPVASYQEQKPATSTIPAQLAEDTRFVIKVSTSVSTRHLHTGDLVAFEVVENVWDKTNKHIVIAKGTPVFGEVTRRTKRHFPGRNGTLRVQLRKVRAVDGQLIPLYVTRDPAEPGKETPGTSKVPPTDKEREKLKTRQIRGRTDRKLSPLIPAGAAAAAAYLQDDTATAIAFVTLIQSPGVGEVLAGADAKLDAGWLYEVQPQKLETIRLPAPAPAPMASPGSAPGGGAAPGQGKAPQSAPAPK